MKYNDYRIVAKKHLTACQSILQQYEDDIPENVLREVHYLAGYIIEGLCVYAIFKHYGWEASRDVKEYDPNFTQRTHLDFYKNGTRLENGKVVITGAKYNISHHGFHQYVELLDNPLQNTCIPYFDKSCAADNEVMDLIDEWKTDLRYRYGVVSVPNQTDIINLIKHCEIIYKGIIKNV